MSPQSSVRTGMVPPSTGAGLYESRDRAHAVARAGSTYTARAACLPSCQVFFAMRRCAEVDMSPLQLLTHCVRTSPLVLRPLVPHRPVVGKAAREVNSSKIQCVPSAAASVADRREARWLHHTRAVSVQAEHRRARGGQGDHRGTIGAFIPHRTCILNSDVCTGADP